MIKTVVFDFDGVIVDSNAVKQNAWSLVFNDRDERANKILKEIVDSGFDGDRFQILEKALVTLGEGQENISTFIKHYANRYNALVFEDIIKNGMFSGVREVLGKLSKKYPLYINSATPEAPLKEIVNNLKLNKYFKNVYGRPATKLENLKKVKDIESIDQESILMIGDSNEDLLAAKNFNTKFIGIKNKFNKWSKEDFLLVPDLIKVEDLINNHF